MKTENLSKTGARFLSEKDYPMGASVFVAVLYTPGEEPLESKAVVEAINVQQLLLLRVSGRLPKG